MNDEDYQQFLQKKANEISDHLAMLNFQCTYKLIEYGINFTLYLVGRTAGITLYHSPKKSAWKFYSIDEWAIMEIKPKIESWLGQKPITTYNNSASTTRTSSTGSEQIYTGVVSYFAGALESFCILQSFAEEYIDFSIICEQAQIGIKYILDDTHSTHLDQQALQTMLTIPPSSDFIAAKEYLSQCLTLCQIPTHL